MIYKFNPDYIIKNFGDGYLLVPVTSSPESADKIFAVDSATGIMIIQQISEGISSKQIICSIVDNFEVEKEKAEEDFEEFVDVLTAEGIIEKLAEMP